jgi:multiple sugar transport system permease protein
MADVPVTPTDERVAARLRVIRRRRRPLEPRYLPYLFVAATVLIIAVFNIIPLAFALWDSVHNDSPLRVDRGFIGLQNYIDVLSDPAFQNAAANTLKYLLITVVGVLGVGLPTALWLRTVRIRRDLLIAVVLIPWAVPGTVTGELWALILKPTNGMLNGVLLNLHVIDSNIIWLQGPTAIPFVAVTLIWQTAPIAALILLAGLEYIPSELYEQAKVDGASSVRAFLGVTLPLLRPAIAIAIVVASIAAVGIFDQIYVLNANSPKTISLVQQTYLYAFKVLDFGLGISASMIATLVSVALSFLALRFVYREIEFS